jgi:hypothetical protein
MERRLQQNFIHFRLPVKAQDLFLFTSIPFAKALVLDKSLLELQPVHVVVIVATILILAALYMKFW